ncbi:dockerin type I domain-containing protein [Rhodopirellula sp. JC740]|uniref:Dockerin type I domain-containing protein n=1 Tax=Rhodopirellula halodulae TaxID=2894198 RepID=A0ABS8NQI1_9BACT|nr:dockerin type I domain-containing protein [Rhodopirellula sp. JC740]MCC9645088.1 dockerin type I domain-containing protein [Rhodopirellula sp. JC740]
MDSRRLLAADACSPAPDYWRMDVSGDKTVTALDALQIINQIGDDDVVVSPGSAGDVHVDGRLTSLDALRIINALDAGVRPPLELANDTATGGGTNRDSITNDLALRGTVCWLADLPESMRTLHVVGIDTDGQLQSRLIHPSRVTNNTFEISDNDLPYLARSSGGATFPTRLTVVQGFAGTTWSDRQVIGELDVIRDRDAPQLFVERTISPTARYIDVSVLDGTSITPESLRSLDIQFVSGPFRIDTVAEVETITNTFGTRFRFPINAINDANPYQLPPPILSVQADLEDIAGNTRLVETTMTIDWQEPNPRYSASVVEGWSALRPEHGSTFDSDVPAVNPGQYVRVRVDVPRSSPLIVSQGYHRGGAFVVERRSSHAFLEPGTGIISWLVHDQIVTGPLTWSTSSVTEPNREALPSLRVVPSVSQFDADVARRGKWSLSNEHLGGIDTELETFRYRFVGEDEIDSTPITREDVATWNPLYSGAPLPTTGFQTVQFANSDGVSEIAPLRFASLPTHVKEFAIDEGKSILGITGTNLVRFDFETAEQLVTRSLSDVFDVPPFHDLGLTGGDWIESLIVIPMDSIAGQIELFDGLETPPSGSVLAIREESWVGTGVSLILDVDTLDPIGTVPTGDLNSALPEQPKFNFPYKLLINGDWIYHLSPYDSSVISRQLLSSFHYGRLVNDNRTARADLSRLDVTAELGTPADPSQPSINAGQRFRLEGEGFSWRSTLLVQPDDSGISESLEPRETDLTSILRPDRTGDDGTWAEYIFPESQLAIVKVVLQESGQVLPLQHVPSIRLPDRSGSWNTSPSIPPENRIPLRLGDIIISGTSDSYRLTVDGMEVSHLRMINARLKERFSPASNLRVQSEIVIENDFGRMKLELPQRRQPIGESWQIEAVDSFEPCVGGQIDYVQLDEGTVLAGSFVRLQMSPPNGRNGSEDVPANLSFQLWMDSDGNLAERVIDLPGQYADGLATVHLPLNARSGRLRVWGSEPNTRRMSDWSFRLEIAPTIVAQVGDSRQAGSTVLLAGNELGSMRWFIDDIPATSKPGPDVQRDELRSIELRVPEGVTKGVLRFERNDVAAISPPILPWWIGDPPSLLGDLTYPGLPATEDFRLIQWLDRTAADHHDAEPGAPWYYRRVYNLNGAVPSKTPNVIGKVEEGVLVESYVPRTNFDFWLFGPVGDTSLNWLLSPTLIDGIRASLNQPDDEIAPFDKTIEVLLSDQANGLLQLRDTSLHWGDQSWSQANMRFNAFNLRELPKGPMWLESDWGAFTFDFFESPALVETISNLTADHGTPADPSRPSVNVGQVINVSGDFINSGDNIYFSRLPGKYGQHDIATWTMGDGLNPRRPSNVPVDSTHEIRVPREAVTGWIRPGLAGAEMDLQIVPRLSRSTDAFSFDGVEVGDRLRLGQLEIVLTPEDIAQRYVKLDLESPRFRNVAPSQLQGSAQLTGRGGQSNEIPMPPILTSVQSAITSMTLPSGVTAFQSRETVTVSGVNLNALRYIDFLTDGDNGDPSQYYRVHDFEFVDSSQRSVRFVLPDVPSKLTWLSGGHEIQSRILTLDPFVVITPLL